MKEQRGDETPTLFAFYDTREDTELFHVEHPGQTKLGWVPGSDQVSCWATYTTPETERIVRNNLKRSALYAGEIDGVGPRYCPSIEDKFVRFADKERHLIFLEPEGRHTDEWYINGLSTSLPFDVQVDMVRSVLGLEHAVLLRPAYAVEYDFSPPTQLFPSLESKKVENLFFAGQINGTSGYEEAAAQGLVAGVNAVLKTRAIEPMIIGREEAYIGVMIDDLVTKGTKEPYRMFTSRAEYRLLFNHGSAEVRLLHHAERYNLLQKNRLQNITSKAQQIEEWVRRLEKERTRGGSFGDLVRRGGAPENLPEEFRRAANTVKDEVIYRIRYQGYIERELRQIDKLKNLEAVGIPQDIDYQTLRGLRTESVLKLEEIRPLNLGQASRISGVNPSDVSILMVAVSRQRVAEVKA